MDNELHVGKVFVGEFDRSGMLGRWDGTYVWFDGGSFSVLGAPARQIICVKSNAKEIGWNKAELSRLDPNKANDQTIYGSNKPAMPHFFPD